MGERRYDGWRLDPNGGCAVTEIVSAAILQDGRYCVVTCHTPEAKV